MAKLGRKPKVIDEKLLENLTKLHLSNEVIAHCVGCSQDTLERRFAEKMSEWRSQSKGKIAQVLYDEALNKREPWALKTIAQRHLGYADKVEQEVKHEGVIIEYTTEKKDTST